MKHILTSFRNYISANRLINNKDRILLSMSAGKDSMFMLDLMLCIREEFNLELGIFHLNHLMRGEQSDLDELFVKETAQKHNIKFYPERFDFKKIRSGKMSFEEHAREVRYSLLKRISVEEGYIKIATAHNKNDNAETVLMRILSGTGIAGIKGISAISGSIIRPVLFADKDEIYEYLKINSTGWREDESNRDESYLRNFIRNSVLPLIAYRFPDCEKSIVNLSIHAIENQNLLFRLVDRLYPDIVIKSDNETTILTGQIKYDPALLKLILGKVLSDRYDFKMKISIYDEIIRRLAVNTANMVLYQNDNLTIRSRLYNGETALSITENDFIELPLDEWEYKIDTVNNIPVKIQEIKKIVTVASVDYRYYIENKGSNDIAFIQPDNDNISFTIRNRRSGDRIAIKNGTKKIKEIMIEKKLDTVTKTVIPLLTADGLIAAYLPGLVISDNNRVSCNFHIRDDTKRILAFFFSDY